MGTELKVEEPKKTMVEEGQGIIADSMKIARGEKEAPKEEAKDPKTSEKSSDKKEEGKEKEVTPEVAKVKADYEARIAAEERKTSGLLKEIAKKKEQIRKLRETKAPQAPDKVTPASVDKYIESSKAVLKKLGFDDKQLDELKERAVDDPFSVITAISYAMTNAVKDETVSSILGKDNEEKAKEIEETEKERLEVFINTRRESTDRVAKKHPEMYKQDSKGALLKDEKGLYVIDDTNPKTKIYVQEADAILKDFPNLHLSPDLPELVMQRMELMLMQGDSFEKGKEAEAERQERVKDAFTVDKGRGNPDGGSKKKEYKLTPEEKEQAEKEVARGNFKSVQEWAEYREVKSVV